MEPNESHHHQHHHEEEKQQQHLSSSYYNPFHHNPIAAAPSTGNSISSFNNGNFQLPNNDGSSSSPLFSVPSSAVNVPIDPVKRKRGRPRKYETPAQALAAKKLASSASNSSARERRKQAAIAGFTPPISESDSRKSLSGYSGRTGQSFTPQIITITPGEDVAQKIFLFAQESEHELCVLSASGSISNASLSHMASGTSVSYEGQYEILSLNGSYIRGEDGGKIGGLSVSLSSSNGQIFGGGVGGLLKASSPVQVILGTFQLEENKDGRNGVRGDDASGSANMLPSPSGTEPFSHPCMIHFRRTPNINIRSFASDSATDFMRQPPRGMTQSRISQFGGTTDMTHALLSQLGSTGYDLSGMGGNKSSEN